MKIALAQVQSFPGNISANISRHMQFITQAVSLGANLVVFPELSLTNYEPGLAAEFAADIEDEVFQPLQQVSDSEDISIVVGMPTTAPAGIFISCLIFQPKLQMKVYHKQILHDDEKPFFIPGTDQVFFRVENNKIALAICYESLQEQHMINAIEKRAAIYLAPVSKPKRIIGKAYEHYQKMAKKHKIPVLMVNGIGAADNFIAAGNSGYWDKTGTLIAQLDDASEAILLIDTAQEKGSAFAVTNNLQKKLQ